MTFLPPLSKRRSEEMCELREKAEKDEKAKRKLRRLCRQGMLEPSWER